MTAAHECCRCCRWGTPRGYACCSPGNGQHGCVDAPPHTCPACRIADELTAHRNQTAARWGKERAMLNFCAYIARSYCTKNEEQQ